MAVIRRIIDWEKDNISKVITFATLPVIALLFALMIVKEPGIPLIVSSVFLLLVFLYIFPSITFLIILGLYSVTGTYYLQGLLFNIQNMRIYPQDIIALTLAIYILLNLLNPKKRKSLFSQKSSFYFFLFLCWGLLAIVRGLPLFGKSAIGEARWYVFTVFYYFAFLLSDNPTGIYRLIIKWFPAILFFMLCSRFINFYFLTPLSISGYGRLRFLTATDSLLISFAFIYLLFIFVSKMIRHSGLIQIILLALFLIIVITQVRSVWVTTSVGILVVIIFSSIKRPSIKPLAILSIGVISLILLSPVIGQYAQVDVFTSLEESASFVSDPTLDRTGSWRITGWQQQIDVVRKNLFMGEGIGRYSEWFDGQSWQRVSVHNGYIMNLSKFGLIGAILFVFGMFFWYKEIQSWTKINQKNKKVIVFSYLFQTLVLMHLVFTFFYDFTIYFWVLLVGFSYVTKVFPNNSQKLYIGG